MRLIDTIPAYVINLARDVSRRQAIEAQFEALPNLKPEFVTGVDGATLPDQVCAWLSDSDSWASNKGTIGCFLSHVQAWELLVQSGSPYAIILEDDADIFGLSDLPHLALPEDFDIIFINDQMSPAGGVQEILSMRDALRHADPSVGYGLYGYLLSARGAAKLVSACKEDLYFGHVDGRVVRYATSADELAALGDLPTAHVIREHHHSGHMPRLGLLQGYVAAMPLVRHMNGSSSRAVNDAVQVERKNAVSPATIISSSVTSMPAASPAEIKRQPLTVLARDSVTVFDAVQVNLPHICVYENVHEYDRLFAKHLLRDIYISRSVDFNGVALATLPPGTIVHANSGYVTTIGGVFLEEQFHHDWHQSAAPGMLASTIPAIEVAGDVLLLARYDALNWRHWVGEILPRALVAECAAPGKYRFAVPEAYRADVNSNFLAALRAYGIDEDRLIFLGRHHYVFERLATVSSMWVYPYAIHPEALALLRTGLKQPVPRAPEGAAAAAMLQQAGTDRHIRNIDETLALLKIKGITPFSVGDMPFIEQVALFREARTVFGALGSNLTGLIYSPQGVQTVSAAPGNWGDCFFHGLLQAHDGIYADLRGTSDARSTDMMTAPFTLSIGRIAYALEAVGYGDEKPTSGKSPNAPATGSETPGAT